MRFFTSLIFCFICLKLSANVDEYLSYEELHTFEDLKEEPSLKVFTSDGSLVIECNGHYFNVLKLQHPYNCPACESFKKEYRN